MGKKKQIRNLKSEIERLRKNVIDRENAIDKLLSDTITDSEKNVIKFDRQFAKSVQKEFDRNLLAGSMVKGPSYDCVNGTFTPTDKQKADVEVHRDKFLNNMNIYNKETNLVDKPNFIQSAGRQYRHTEEADKLYVEFSINHGDKFVKSVEWGGDGVIKTKITYPDADGAPKTMADIHDDINLMETIVKMPGCNLSDKEEIERLREENEEFRLNAKKSIDLSFQQLKVHIAEKDEMKSCILTLSQENENLRMQIVRLKHCLENHQKADKRDAMIIENNSKFINEGIQKANHLKAQEQNSRISKMVNDFTANELKDVGSYNEKYIFLSDYHISSPYINEDIVIKEGTIISLLRGNTYGSENTMVLFPYQNVKLMEEKGIVRRLSPLEMCGEPQVCVPAKEEERPTHPPRPMIITELPKTLESLDKIERFRCRDAYIIKNEKNEWVLNGVVVLTENVLEDWINGDITPVWDK